jgi:sulfate adenylyltransferase subunit 1 (EFTu-like GTPase family)
MLDGGKPLLEKGKYAVKHTTKEVRAIVKEILYKVNINTLHRNPKIRKLTVMTSQEFQLE